MSEHENEISTSASAPAVRRDRKAAASSGAGFFTRMTHFVRDTRAELRRVSWPTLNDVKNTTIITLVAVVFFALYLFGIDRLWAFLIDNLFTWLGGRV
jgi:preprotein translocase subunit SecE